MPYRTEPITVPNGQQTRFDAQTPDSIAALLAEAVAQSPGRLIAASSPGRKWHYELTLVSPTTSSVFIFDCEPLHGRFHGLYRRTCRLKEIGRPARIVFRQMGSPFDLILGHDDRGTLPKPFRRKGGVLGEITWCIDQNDLPVPGCAALRYPIAYPTEHVKSGYGFDISGPFISGRARHSLSSDLRNKIIKDAGRSAFARLFRDKLIPHFGAASIDLISCSQLPDAEAEDQLVAELLRLGALPVINRTKSKHSVAATMAESASVAPVTIASYTYNREQIDANLALLARSASWALHPAVPKRIVESLFRIQARGDRRVIWFNQLDAAREVLIDTAPDKDSVAAPNWIESASLAVVALDVSRHHAALPQEFVRQLKNEAMLPTRDGRVAAWVTFAEVRSLYRKFRVSCRRPSVSLR